MLSIDNKSKSLSNRKIVRRNDNPKGNCEFLVYSLLLLIILSIVIIIVVEGKIKDWDFDAQVGLALRTIFQNPNYIPSDPYKVLIYILKSNELKKSIHMDYSVSRVKRQSTMSMYCDDYIKSTSALGAISCFGLNLLLLSYHNEFSAITLSFA